MSHQIRNCHRCGKDFSAPYKEALCEDCLNVLGWEPTPKTNADHIRSMTDEELVEFKYSGPFHCKEKDPRYCKRDKWVNGRAPCEQCYLEWLKKPYKEEA